MPNKNYLRFLSAIFISGVTATPGDVNIIAIEKVIPENIGIAVGILFLCAIETKSLLNIGFSSFFRQLSIF